MAVEVGSALGMVSFYLVDRGMLCVYVCMCVWGGSGVAGMRMLAMDPVEPNVCVCVAPLCVCGRHACAGHGPG